MFDDPKFAFVSFDPAGEESKATRKLIRSHCMVGKNSRALSSDSRKGRQAQPAQPDGEPSQPSRSCPEEHVANGGSLDCSACVFSGAVNWAGAQYEKST